MPTTVGTGSEISAVACVDVQGRHRLAVCTGLRAEIAVLDPEATGGLPRLMLIEGVLEALMRLTGPLVGSQLPRAVGDAAGLALIAELVRLGDQLAVTAEPTAAQRLLAAELSAYTHASWALSGRDPFGGRAWYLANEVSSVLGVSKMVATVPAAAGVWARVAEGDRRFGHPDRLAVVWGAVRAASSAPLGDDAGDGLRRLAAGWGVPPCPTPGDPVVEVIARQVTNAFGGGLPPLAGISGAEIRELLRQSLRHHPDRSQQGAMA